MTRTYTQEEVEACVNLAIDEAPLLREGYRNTSVRRIIENATRPTRSDDGCPPDEDNGDEVPFGLGKDRQ